MVKGSSTKRAAVFALMGPALFFAAFLICRGEPDGFVDVVILTFFLTFPDLSSVEGSTAISQRPCHST